MPSWPMGRRRYCERKIELILMKHTFQIYSPGFPYDASTPCDYNLTAPIGKKVQVEVRVICSWKFAKKKLFRSYYSSQTLVAIISTYTMEMGNGLLGSSIFWIIAIEYLSIIIAVTPAKFSTKTQPRARQTSCGSLGYRGCTGQKTSEDWW